MPLTIRSFRRSVLPIVGLFAVAAARASAQSAPVEAEDLSLEGLMQMRITSVSREEQDVLRTSAAVYVISQQDIRRSGVTDVAELLRTVPGLNVARVNSSTWAISARGFNAQYATKLLVLVDGRSVYDPTFSGVLWHLENLPLEDIDRIEVIRGPGATMWGANAVNGVVSITTKRAVHTPGGVVRAQLGSGRPGDASVRFGGGIGAKAAYRVFARQSTRSASETPAGEDGGDHWNLTTTGMRVDWDVSARDLLMVQGAVYGGGSGNPQAILTSVAPIAFGRAGWASNYGANVLARWTRALAPRSGLKVQFYYDGRRADVFGTRQTDTVDLDLQHSVSPSPRHQVTWGIGYRSVRDLLGDTVAFGFTPPRQIARLGSAFVQDQVTLVPEKLFLTIGTKFEGSSVTGVNAQPAVRAVWQPTERQSLWVASARAIRTVSRVDRGLRLVIDGFETPGGPTLVEILGSDDTTSEEMIAHEMGYRYQPRPRMWFDVAAFYNLYDHLSVVQAGAPFFDAGSAFPHLVVPLYFTSDMHGATYGVEASGHYQVLDALMVTANYSRLEMDLSGPLDPALAHAEEGNSPRNRSYVGATLKLPRGVDVSGDVYMTGVVPAQGVPAYTRLDLNASWQVRQSLRLRLVGQNLQGPHLEHGNRPSPSTVVKRAVHLEAVFAF